MEKTVTDPKLIKVLETKLFDAAKRKNIDRAIDDVEKLCDLLQAAAHSRHPNKFLGTHAFGMHQGLSGSSIVGESPAPYA